MTKLRFNPLSAALVAAALALGGCASKVKLDETAAPVETRNPAGTGAAASTAQSQVTGVDLSKNTGNTLSSAQRTVFFDYDSFMVKDEYRPVVETNARLLSTDRAKRATVEGHTDERGGSEYNLALGQKRAESVTRALVLLGATAAQVEATSFGKERPAATGSDEAAWAKNRRAEINVR